MSLENLSELFYNELRDIYSAERQIVKALPKMIKNASSPQLTKALEMHLQETEKQVERIESAFDDTGKAARAKMCEGMKGLLKEGEEMLKEKAEPEVMDAAIIASAQKVEHYEISSYGTVRAFAEQLGRQDAIKLLNQSLDEEYGADRKLSAIAESMVNKQAAR